MDLAGHKVDAGQQADRAEALIFMIAGERRMHAVAPAASRNRDAAQC
jgi:hypothetical protein